ncbi:MAG: hypothetical protein IJ506_06465 [Clostridia bacterium]|nr:hypothetical protein [Clostridia bacterium]
MKKFVASILAATCVLGAIGCGPVGADMGNNDADSDKTEITVKNYNGGVGRKWLDNAVERFTEAYANESFAEGKTGIDVKVLDGDLTTIALGSEAYQVYITSGAYMSVSELAQLGILYDMTGIVTDTTRKGDTLENLIYDGAKPAFMHDGKYYGLPHYANSNGVSFDRDLFDEAGLYFADEEETDVVAYTGKDIKITRNFVSSEDAKKTVGMDGVKDTEDDGMPCSLEEFILLMDYIKNEKSDMSISPIVVSGKYHGYIQLYLQGLTFSLAGSEQMNNYSNCTGEIDIITGYTEEPLFPGIDYIKKPIVETVTLTEEDKNGYLTTQLAAKYYAMATVEIIHKEGYFAKEAYNTSVDHYSTQKCMIYAGAAEYDRVAMLMEGSYWYNEAKKSGVLNSYVTISGDREERGVAWMSLPTAVYSKDVKEGEISPIFTGPGAQVVINANIKGNTEYEKACAAFVSFLYSDEELAAFTVETGCTRNLKYSLTDEEIGKMPKFYQSLWNSRKEDGSNTLINYPTTATGLKVASHIELNLNSAMWEKFNLYHYVRGTKNTKQMFEDMKYTASKWNEVLDS